MSVPDIGTVALTGANGLVGRALLDRLSSLRIRTVAIVRQAVRLPATKVQIGSLDAPNVQSAIREADIVVHLAGTFFPVGKSTYWSDNVGTAEHVANAIKEGKARRMVFLSHVGAREDSKNAFFRTKAIAERILSESGKNLVIFRCTHIVGTPKSPGPFAKSLLAKPGKKAGVLGSGRQIIAPIFVGDVVSAIVAAFTAGEPGTYELAGPERMPLDDLVRLLNRNPEIGISHLPPWLARVFGAIVPMLPSPFVDAILADCVGDPALAKQTFGLKLTSLRSVWT